LNVGYKAHEWGEALDKLMLVLANFPEAKSVNTVDPQTRYFALAAWYWKAEAEAREEYLDGQDQEHEAWKEGYTRALNLAIETHLNRLGASGAPDPTVREVLHALLVELSDLAGVESFSVSENKESPDAD
jgi:hypothetical protein